MQMMQITMKVHTWQVSVAFFDGSLSSWLHAIISVDTAFDFFFFWRGRLDVFGDAKHDESSIMSSRHIDSTFPRRRSKAAYNKSAEETQFNFSIVEESNVFVNYQYFDA